MVEQRCSDWLDLIVAFKLWYCIREDSERSPLCFFALSCSVWYCCLQIMDKRRRKKAKTQTCCSEEVSSIEWEFINMTEQEEDLIFRMYKLVGDRWALIAGRVPGRKAEEIERFWIMRHGEGFASRRKELSK